MASPNKDASAPLEPTRLQRTILYKEPCAWVDWDELKTFVESQGVLCELREDPFPTLPEENLREISALLAQGRVLNAHSQELNECPYPVEKDYEYRHLKSPEHRKPGAVYSGFLFQNILASLIPAPERTLNTLHVFFTLRRLATWEDARWHLRTILLGFPMVVSLPGIGEAPARDREYYLLTSIHSTLGEAFLSHSPDWLSLNDPRMTNVIKGYLLQALFFQWKILKKEEFAFCENPSCALYNSHWQREVLHAQLPHSLCEKHLKEMMRYSTLPKETTKI